VYVRCSKTGCEVLDGVASSAITRLAVPCLIRRAIVRDPDVTVWHPAQEYLAAAMPIWYPRPLAKIEC
jgi:hypothetical protein